MTGVSVINLLLFSQDELRKASRQVQMHPCFFSEVHVFPQGSCAFEGACSEQEIRLIRGPANRFHNVVHFCIAVFDLIPGIHKRQTEIFDQVPVSQIVAKEIEGRLQQTASRILETTSLVGEYSFGDGIVLIDQWNELLFVWENQASEFVAYYWNTSA